LARDLKLIKPNDYEKLAPLTIEIKRMLTVFIQKLNAESYKRAATSSLSSLVAATGRARWNKRYLFLSPG
jgi:hypothetical protein